MADGKIEYELTIDARRGLDSVSGAAKAADQLAAGADKAAKAFGNISGEKIRSFATLVGMAALDLGAAAMRVNGMSVGAGRLQGAATGALQMGMAGGMMGGGPGAAIGAAVGAGLGVGKALFGEIESAQKEAERVNRLFQEIGANTAIAVDAVGRLDTPDELEASLERVSEQMFAIQERARRGLLEGWVAREQLTGLQLVADAANAALPAARAREEAEKAAKDGPSLASRQADTLTAMGAILGGGGMSAANDHARSTATNTARMVQLLERIGGAGGGSTWQP